MKWLVIIWVLSFAYNIGHAGVLFFQQWSEFTEHHIVTYLRCSYKKVQVIDTPPPFFLGIQDGKNKMFAQITNSDEYVKIDPPWSHRWDGIGHADGVFEDAYIMLTNHNVSAEDGGKYFCEGRYKMKDTNVVVHMNITSLEFEVETTEDVFDTISESDYSEYK